MVKRRLLRIKLLTEDLIKFNSNKKEEIVELYYSLLIKVAKDEIQDSDFQEFYINTMDYKTSPDLYK